MAVLTRQWLPATVLRIQRPQNGQKVRDAKGKGSPNEAASRSGMVCLPLSVANGDVYTSLGQGEAPAELESRQTAAQQELRPPGNRF